jgi:crotonobetainyl-CoA:carnitine CoA-transferase CaiB-like acyl-CoA transferase
VVGRPVKFVGEEQAPLEAPPVLGADTRTVLSDVLDLTEADLDELEKDNVIL